MNDSLRRLYYFLSPMKHLGERNYSPYFAFIATIIIYALLEGFFQLIIHNPGAIGIYAIFTSVTLIIYFSFRSGLPGGFVTTLLTVLFYIYLIASRPHTPKIVTSGLETTAVLGIIYLLLSSIIGWLKQTLDVLIERETDEKRRLQSIIQQLPVGVLITDSHGKLIQRNRQLDEILGVSLPLGFMIGKDSLKNGKINGKTINPTQSPLAQALSKGKVIANKEMVYEREDGKNVYLQINSTPIRNRNGKIIAAASIISDISGQKEMEKRKDDFVNMASHELKTPLTSMKIYIDILMKRLSQHDDTTQKIIRSVKNQTDNLQELVSDLLDVTKIQTGKLSLKKEKFRLDELIKDTVEAIQGSTKQSIVIDKLFAINITADKFRIYQVLTNLLTNAIKYSSQKGDIHVKIKRETGKLVVSVQDEGIGIAKDQQHKIFDRLYQVTDDKEKTFPGLGMGLYISKEIIKRHKGEIWVESQKGKGSTFFFRLPIHGKTK